MKKLLATLSVVLFANPASAEELTQKQKRFKIKSETIMLKGEIIYSAPLKDINGREIDRSAIYHVRYKPSATSVIERGIYICTVFGPDNMDNFTECILSSGD